MSKQVSFFTLPRELRDMIYEFYFIGYGNGYCLNQNSRKLVTADGHFIDLALAYTCKTAASEMRNLPLRLNTIHITTTDGESCEGSVYRFMFLSRLQAFYLNELLLVAQSFIDDQVLAHVRAVCPHMLPILHAIQQGNRNPYRIDGSWGEVPSMYRQWVAGILQLISKRPGFKNLISRTVMNWIGPSLDEIMNMDHISWVLPLEAHLSEMSRILLKKPESPGHEQGGRLYRQSAATVAISFLESLSVHHRLQLREIVLHEDRVASPWPECHARGLISWCLENPELHIERRVNLWRNVWPESSPDPGTVVAWRDTLRQDRLDVLRSESISRSRLAPWIMEALALPSLGMPPQSFDLVLNGNPTPEATARVFKIAQRDAAWQTGFDSTTTPHTAHQNYSAWARMIQNRSYIMRGFPEAIRDITDKASSLISCNFEPDVGGNKEHLSKISPSWTMETWGNKRFSHEPREFSTEPPLPSWFDLRKEELDEYEEVDDDEWDMS